MKTQMKRAAFAITVVLAASLTMPSASAQRTCAELVDCAEGTIAIGEPPQCACEKAPPRVPLTCESNFGCADGNQVGVGEWPECGCRDLSTPQPAPGDTPPRTDRGPGPLDSLGGVDTCKQFLKCAPGFEMLLWNGRCVCGETMLPPPVRCWLRPA